MSEQEYCNSDDTFGVRLVNHVDDAVLPVGVHDFADAIGRCMLVDKTMFYCRCVGLRRVRCGVLSTRGFLARA